jgi:hypothetical protein
VRACKPLDYYEITSVLSFCPVKFCKNSDARQTALISALEGCERVGGALCYTDSGQPVGLFAGMLRLCLDHLSRPTDAIVTLSGLSLECGFGLLRARRRTGGWIAIPRAILAPATSTRLEVRLLDPQMVGRTWRRSTEAGHVHPRMTGREQRLRISGWRYCFPKQNPYSDID